jgi:hypothetical protein
VVIGVVGALLMLAVVGQSFVAAGATEIDPSQYRLPVRDLASLGDVTTKDPPTFGLKPEAAISAANALYDAKALGASEVQAFLETVTVGGTLASDEPIKDRGVWIVRLSGMAVEQGGPPTEAGKPVAGHILTTAFVFLDAVTGEFIMTVWIE